jgi:hypothetical protein
MNQFDNKQSTDQDAGRNNACNLKNLRHDNSPGTRDTGCPLSVFFSWVCHSFWEGRENRKVKPVNTRLIPVLWLWTNRTPFIFRNQQDFQRLGSPSPSLLQTQGHNFHRLHSPKQACHFQRVRPEGGNETGRISSVSVQGAGPCREPCEALRAYGGERGY